MFYSLFFLLIILILFAFWNSNKKQQAQLSSCCICEKVFKDKIIFNIDELPFCKEHYDFYTKTNWAVLKQETATSQDSQGAMQVYIDKQVLLDNNILCFIRTGYEVKDDNIISLFKLYCPKESLTIANCLLDK